MTGGRRGAVALRSASIKQQSERNAEILRLYDSGQGPTAIARQFGMKRDRVRQIIGLAKHRDKWRTKLVERFGEEPDISALPDNTPIEVLALCRGNIYGWEARLRSLTCVPPTPVKTLGHLRRATDAQLRKDSFVGKGFLKELRRFCPTKDAAATLKSYRGVWADARAALRTPPGSVPAEEDVEQPFKKEVAALVKGILAIVEAKA